MNSTPLKITLDETEYINLPQIILALVRTGRINQIICGCQAGLNRSQTLRAILIDYFVKNGLDLPVKVISIDGVPAVDSYHTIHTDINNDVSVDNEENFKKYNSVNREELLSNEIAEQYIPQNRIIPIEDSKYRSVQDEWVKYAKKNSQTLFVLLNSFVHYRQHQQYLLNIFPNSTFIYAEVPDLITHPKKITQESNELGDQIIMEDQNVNRSSLYSQCGHKQMITILKYRFGLRHNIDHEKFEKDFQKLSDLVDLSQFLSLEEIVKIYNDYDLCFFEQYEEVIKKFILGEEISYINNVTGKNIIKMFLYNPILLRRQ